MRKFIVHEFITLDGVIQSPGSPTEDNSEGFDLGGWIAPFKDDTTTEIMQRILQPADLLLGRKTFDIWEQYWPKHAAMWPGVNEVTKFVLSVTRNNSEWENCTFLDRIEAIKQLKNNGSADIKIWGSSELVQLLMKHDLVDELWLMLHPVILGKGKKLFVEGIVPSSFKLSESLVTTTGVVIGHYLKDGQVKTGNAGSE